MKKKELEFIGVIDMGYEGMSLLESIYNSFPHENIIYVNDPKRSPYEGRNSEDILELVSASYEKIKNYKLKMIVVLSDTICEHALDYLESLELPVINVVDILTRTVNKQFNNKNILYVARNSFLETNIIQKNIKYSHLYTCEGENLIKHAEEKNVKTGESFSMIQSLVKPFASKNIEVVISTSPLITMYHTEFKEYLKDCDVLMFNHLINEEINKKLKAKANEKDKGEIYIVSPCIDKDYLKEYKNKCNRFIRKYKLI